MATIENPPNSVWPNGLKVDSEGYVTFYPLGTNKVNVPTIRAQWPKGDKLVSPFVYRDEKLVGFIDTKAFTTDSQTTIYLPYEHIEAEFSAIDKGQLEIYAPNATTKKVSWKNSGKEDIPEVQFKYKGCTTVDDVTAVDANYQTTDIVDGVWSEPLWDLEQGGGMFRTCDNLTSFSSNLPSLTNGSWMFGYCDNLTSFSSDLSSLTIGSQMFAACDNLTSFSSNLSKLQRGNQMFASCDNLTSFTSNLSRLSNGINMFDGCKLDAPSVKNIIDTILTRSVSSGVGGSGITLGMGCDDTEADKNLFAQEVGYADMTSLLAALRAKKWVASAQYNGRPTTTYSMRRTSEDILPVFVKLEETEEHADYTSMDGSKKYRLDWFHETTGSTEGYTQFASLEEAVTHFNIKPIERN